MNHSSRVLNFFGPAELKGSKQKLPFFFAFGRVYNKVLKQVTDILTTMSENFKSKIQHDHRVIADQSLVYQFPELEKLFNGNCTPSTVGFFYRIYAFLMIIVMANSDQLELGLMPQHEANVCMFMEKQKISYL